MTNREKAKAEIERWRTTGDITVVDVLRAIVDAIPEPCKAPEPEESDAGAEPGAPVRFVAPAPSTVETVGSLADVFREFKATIADRDDTIRSLNATTESVREERQIFLNLATNRQLENDKLTAEIERLRRIVLNFAIASRDLSELAGSVAVPVRS